MKTLTFTLTLLIIGFSLQGFAQTSPVLVDAHQPEEVIDYPYMSKLNALEGKVKVFILVDKEGSVERYIVSTTTHSDFKDACMEGIKKLKFYPATDINGEPVSGWATLVFNFELQI